MGKCTCPVDCNGGLYSCPSNKYYDKPMSENPDWQRHIHDQNLASYDSHIARLEKELAEVNEGRREYVNRHNLNKG